MDKRAPKPPLRIGFFAPTDNEYVERLTEGLLRYQADRGGCVIRDFHYDSRATENQEEWAKRPLPWADWHPDGLVVNISEDPGLAEWVDRSAVPVVNTSGNSTYFPSVVVSFDGIARTAIEHFEPLGFTHFAYLAYETTIQRSAIFERRLKPKGFTLRSMNFGPYASNSDDYTEQCLAENPEFVRLLCEAPKPLAILAVSDNLGRVACRAARQLGFQIPQEVAVLGLCNFVICRTCEPPLSSIHAPGDEVGYRAMEILVNAIKGRPAPKRTEVEPGTVRARESTTARGGRAEEVARAMEMIRDRACEGVTVAELLEEVHMSRPTFYREFVTTVGRTPAEEISRIRLERATELLAKSEVSIRRIAEMLGYETPTGFTLFFQSQTGMTPRAYRQTHNAD